MIELLDFLVSDTVENIDGRALQSIASIYNNKDLIVDKIKVADQINVADKVIISKDRNGPGKIVLKSAQNNDCVVKVIAIRNDMSAFRGDKSRPNFKNIHNWSFSTILFNVVINKIISNGRYILPFKFFTYFFPYTVLNQ